MYGSHQYDDCDSDADPDFVFRLRVQKYFRK